MSSEHGTYFEVDGSKANFTEALETWVPIAYDLLIEVASKYNRTTTYLELTQAVQDRSGIRTRMLIANWSGKLLEKVAKRAAEAGEPPLTALCVRPDGTIGEGYSQAPKSVPTDPSAPVDDLAAQHRLLCYRRFANDLPADGGTPTLTPQVARARSARAKPGPKPPEICHIHGLEKSAVGECDMCED
ncbi:hypothetical protein [Garicola koreensis]|uniref:Uncharacterized protein n=1 Tax=Garicola koreensis TaxID=1262554 RepID=A0A7W5XNF9_9MICC|nr:hypothetical protein [Garicola koreensis]MBB3666607.1 hypothetical protein [Garicola koreensis]